MTRTASFSEATSTCMCIAHTNERRASSPYSDSIRR
jgi:hypothetical protein